ncbi:MAG: hypothetical protein LCI00_16525 [Chloroflexi bacterium]|nr:hypothetical protein [Chloroflexota bacterium]MCC6896595.1 hypothetical protein [Anaerolineae bacterium]
MSDHPNARTVAELEKMITGMQFLVDHPRMQQRNWVASGKKWLPILHHAVEDLQRETKHNDFVAESYQEILAALERVGLRLIKRDNMSWGYSWHDDVAIGAFVSRSAALEAALRERIGTIHT